MSALFCTQASWGPQIINHVLPEVNVSTIFVFQFQILYSFMVLLWLVSKGPWPWKTCLLFTSPSSEILSRVVWLTIIISLFEVSFSWPFSTVIHRLEGLTLGCYNIPSHLQLLILYWRVGLLHKDVLGHFESNFPLNSYII